MLLLQLRGRWLLLQLRRLRDHRLLLRTVEVMKFLDNAPRFLFFTGKGGVGKTSIACAAASHRPTVQNLCTKPVLRHAC
jgi:AAA+ superfamily predicted ATPase